MPTAVMSGETGIDVVGLGAATLDELWLVKEFQAAEGVQQALDHVTMGGGPVATALAVLASLGRSTALVDVCGDDAAGGKILAELDQLGVSTQFMQKVASARSAQAVVQVRAVDGARQILFLPSSAGEPKLNARITSLISSARVLHVNGRHESMAREAVRFAQESGVTISFDGGAGRYRDSIRDLVEASHLRIVSREFAARWSGAGDIESMMRSLESPPARLVIITDGAHGSHARCPGEPVFHQPAHTAARLVDTTGCGDVYHGAFLHGWLSGWDVRRSVEFASDLAARNAEGLGGRFVCFDEAADHCLMPPVAEPGIGPSAPIFSQP